MSQAEDLLNSLADDGSWIDMNNHIVIGSDRYWVVPEDVKKIAVENDHNIETITFDCPRYWDGRDMSQMRVYINYMRADDEKGADLATNVVVDEEDDTIMHFNWTITGHLSAVQGPVTTLVCIQKVAEDGTEERHWNSELCTDLYISPGMECEAEVIAHYPGIITAVLHRMDEVEELTTREAMLSYVETYLMENSSDWLKVMFESEQINAMIQEHLANEGVQTFVDIEIGVEEPDHACLWFDTDEVNLPDSPVRDNFEVVCGPTKPNYKCLWLKTK